jgi:hypothetical protein
MMTTSTNDKSLACQFNSIVRLVVNESPSGNPAGGAEAIQRLVDLVTELWMHVEYLMELRLSKRHEDDIRRYVDELRNNYAVLGRSPGLIPSCHATTSLPTDLSSNDDDLMVVSPTMLRGGRFHAPCDLPDERSGVFIRSLGWRYLTALVAMKKLTMLELPQVESLLAETQRALLSTARTQRRAIRHVLPAGENVAGDLTALTWTSSGEDHFVTRLICVTEFRNDGFGVEPLLSRARAVLADQEISHLNHSIWITDDMSGTFVPNRTYCQHDENINLVGNPDDGRFFIFVSDVPDHNRPSDSADRGEGRFRLNRSRLRDTFLGIVKEERDLYPAHLPRTTVLPTLRLSSRGRGLSVRFGTDDVHLEPPSVTERSDTVISRQKTARVFFGYKGLTDLDPT